MKKIKYLVFFISLFAFCINAKAASGNLSVSSYDVYENDTFYVTVDVAAAAWNVHVNADGPVIGCSINQADASADAMDTTKSFSTSCTATGTGTISIYLSGDVTSASDGNAVDISDSTSVRVSSRPAPDPEPAPSGDPSPSGNNNDNNNNNNNNNDNNNQDDNKSKNNNVKSISVTGYNLNKIDNNNYSLTVPSNVSSISVNASAEDSKANVSGAGKHDLVIGENTIEVVITSESGSQNKIVLKITRKSENTLDDIDSVLKDDKTDNSFTIGKNDVISKDNIKKIIDSKETVDLNYYDDNKNLIYSWKLDGSKIKTSSDLDTTISFDSDNKKDILKSSNYADGLIVNLNSKNVPEGTKIKLFVGNKYSDSDTVNVYYYDGKELQNVSENLKIQNGYIEIDADNGNEYFITMSDVKNVGSSKKVEGSNSMTIVLLVLLGIILIANIIFIIHVLSKKKKNQIQSQTVESYIPVDQPNSDPIINTDVNNTINNNTISNNSIDNSIDNSINNNNININNN